MATKAKAKKPVKKKLAAKKSKVTKLKAASATIGHNGKINKPLKKLFEDHLKMDEDKKAISKAQRDGKARAKDEHGVDKSVFDHEIKLMKMDSARRASFEQGHNDLKDSLGYQMVLPLLEGDESGEDQEGGDPEDGNDTGYSEEDAA